VARVERVSFRDASGHFASPKGKGVRVYRGRKRVTGKARSLELSRVKSLRRNHGRKKKTRSISKGFPQGYTSPFRAFITPVKNARSPERAFALIEIISRRKYEGTAYRNWIPFDLGYMPPDVARSLDDGDVREQFKLSTLKGKNELSKIFGFFMLKPEEARREALTPRLLRLIKYRAAHGNEGARWLPARPKPKRKKRKK
jgi:hypothetical protein